MDDFLDVPFHSEMDYQKVSPKKIRRKLEILSSNVGAGSTEQASP
jgi:hypothetical protein